MVCAIAAGWLANRIQVPYPIVLVLAGIGLGFVYDWPALEIEPDLVLAIVLPAVLYPAAIATSWRDFRRILRPILLLAIGLVATTTLAVGIAFKWLVPQTPWAVAFALGAIVSPPDAVAATAVLRRFRLPRRIVTLLEGESLVNDATGLVLYRFAVVAALTGVFSGWALVGEFGLIALGGIVLGIAMGWITARLQERLHDPMLELAMSLTTPFATYLAVRVAAGVRRPRLGRRRTLSVAVGASRHLGACAPQHSAPSGAPSCSWSIASCSCSSASAAGDRRVAAGQQALSWPRVAGLIAVVEPVAIGVRFLWIFTATYGVRLLVPSLRGAILPPPAFRPLSAGAACGASCPWPPRSRCP